jgi:hypothetical protein
MSDGEGGEMTQGESGGQMQPPPDEEEREGSALGGRKGGDGLIGATGRDVGGNAGTGKLGKPSAPGERDGV